MQAVGAAVLLALGVQCAQAAPTVAGHHSLTSVEFGASHPYAMALDAGRREIWVGGYYSGNLVIVDAVSKKPVASIDGVPYPYDIAVDPVRGRAYVLSQWALHVFDTATRQKLGSFSPVDTYLFRVEVDPSDGDVYLYNQYAPAGAEWRWEVGRHASSTFAVKAKMLLGTSSSAGTSIHYVWDFKIQGSKVYIPYNWVDYNIGKSESGLWVVDKASFSTVQKLALPGAGWLGGVEADPTTGAVYVSDLYDPLWVFAPGSSGELVLVSSVTGLSNPWSVGLDAARHRLYCPDNFSNKVYAVDTQSLQVAKVLPGGYDPSNVVMDLSQGLAFVVNYLSNDISVFDTAGDSLQATIDLRRHTPYDLALLPNSSKAVLTTGLSNGLLVWDRVTGAVDKFILDIYSNPSSLAYFPGLQRLFFKASSFCGGAYLKKFDLPQQALDWSSSWVWGVGGLHADLGSNRLLVSRRYGDYPTYYDRVQLAVVDPGLDTVVKKFHLGPTTDHPKGTASNPSTNRAYVVLYATHQVASVDLASGTYQTIPVGFYPEAVAVDPALNRVFVTNYGSDSLSVLDGATDKVVATLPVGKSPRGVTVWPQARRVYVANSGDHTVSVVDAFSLQTVATLKVGGSPQNVRVDEKTGRVYVTNYSSASVTVIDDPLSPGTQPPVITHAPLSGTRPENLAVSVTADVTDDVGVAMVTLTYWEPGELAYYTVPMANQGGSAYQAQIPAEFLLSLKGDRVAYFIDAADKEASSSPPTGQTPGSASVPNEFTVSKSLAKAWSYSFGQIWGGFYRMTPGPTAAVADIRPDLPGLEIATGNEEFYPLGYSGPAGRWFLFGSTGAAVFWKNTENDEAHSSVNLFDLDGDGSLEMLGGTTSGNELQAWNRNAGWVWRYVLGSHHLSTPAVDVLQPGEPPTVFGGSFDGYFRSIQGKTGALNWAFPAGNWIWSSPSVADLDSDGRKEVVFAVDKFHVGGPDLYVLDASSGTVKWSATLGGSLRSSPAVADLDGDGIREVLIGGPDGAFRAYHGKTGQLLWSYPTQGEIVSSAAVGDLDGDGKLEVVFGSGDGYLYAMGPTGGLRWKAHLGSPVLGSPALAKRGPQAGLDVYVTASAGVLYLIRGSDGAYLAGRGLGAGVVSSPVVADVDGDGKLEIFFQDRKGDSDPMASGDVFWAVRDSGSSVAPLAMEWPMFRRDPAHTGLYPMPDPPPAKVSGLAVSAHPEGERLVLQWNANAETDLAHYRIYRGGNLLGQAASTSYLDTGLTPGTTYTYQVSAVDLTGQEGPKSDPASGIPLPPPDTQPPVSKILSPQNGASLSTTTVLVSGTAADVGWSGVSKVEVWLKDLGTLAEKWVAAEGASSFTVVFAGLQDKGAYRLASRARDAAGNVESVTVYVDFSIGIPPSKVAGLTVEAPPDGGKLKISWNPSPEGDVVSYRVYRGGVQLFQTASTVILDQGLTDLTTYTYRVSAVDSSGLEGPKSDAVSGMPRDLLAPTSRILAPADGSVLDSSTGQVSVSGTAQDLGVSGLAKVELQLVDLTAPSTTWHLAAGTTLFQLALSSLAAGHAYRLASQATDLEGNVENLSQFVQFKIAAPPVCGTAQASLKVPKDGQKVWGNAVTLMAVAGEGTSKVLFQHRKVGTETWKGISTPDSKPPYSVYWNTSDALVEPGTYQLRAVGYDSKSLPDCQPGTIQVAVGDANADIVEDGNPEVDPNVEHRKLEKVAPATTSEVVTADGTKVVIPPGAVPEGEKVEILTLSPKKAPPPKSSHAVIEPAGVFRDLSFTGGTKQFGASLTVVLPAPDENGDGFLDGTQIPVKELKAYHFSEEGKQWVPVGTGKGVSSLAASGAGSGGAGAGGSVTFQVDHFTLFGLFRETFPSAAVTLGEVYAFPNPARGGAKPTLHVEVGKADRLEIRIYDIAGDLVHSTELTTPPSVVDGKYAYRYVWDASSAPSGVYIFVVQARLGAERSVKAKGRLALIK